MNILSLLITLFLTFSSFTVTDPPADKIVHSEIEKATVFLSGAQITRTARVDLRAGLNQIIFTELSSSLNEKSVTISADKQITLLSLHKQRADLKSTATLDSLRNVLGNIDTQLKMRTAEKKVLDYELSILLENKNLKGNNEKISASEIRQAMEYFREKLTEIEKEKIEIDSKIQTLNNKRSVINRQIREIEQDLQNKSVQIKTAIESADAQSVTFTLSYFVSRAGWQPSYDVKVEDIDQPLQLTYKANIHQSTGISWNNIALSVSSAEPMQSTAIPVFNPFYIEFYEEDTQTDAVRQRGISDEEAILGMATVPPETRITREQTSFSFEIEVPFSVEGNGSTQTVSLKEYELPADYRYYAFPKIRKVAYLTARLTEWEDLNLLPGETNLYFNQTFVGQSQLQPSVPGDTLMFSLGKDERIAIERERVKEFSEKNFFGGKVKETKAWQYQIKNNKDEAVSLELIGQIPVSTHEDIKVSLEEHSGGNFDPASGKIRWLINISPGKTDLRNLRYTLEYPSDKKIRYKN